MQSDMAFKYLDKSQGEPKEVCSAIEQDIVEEVMRLTQSAVLPTSQDLQRLMELARDLRQARSA